MLNEIYSNQGPSDAQRMKAIVILINDDQGDTTLEEKLNAWDELELLVESQVPLFSPESTHGDSSRTYHHSLDNANDLKPLGLWPGIIKNLNHSEPDMALQALWVCGTAIQNVCLRYIIWKGFMPLISSPYRILTRRTNSSNMIPSPWSSHKFTAHQDRLL